MWNAQSCNMLWRGKTASGTCLSLDLWPRPGGFLTFDLQPISESAVKRVRSLCLSFSVFSHKATHPAVPHVPSPLLKQSEYCCSVNYCWNTAINISRRPEIKAANQWCADYSWHIRLMKKPKRKVKTHAVKLIVALRSSVTFGVSVLGLLSRSDLKAVLLCNACIRSIFTEIEAQWLDVDTSCTTQETQLILHYSGTLLDYMCVSNLMIWYSNKHKNTPHINKTSCFN